MLSNVRKLFKKGASSPSPNDRPSSFSVESEHSGYKGRGFTQDFLSGSRKSSGKDLASNADLGVHTSTEQSSSNGHFGSGFSSRQPAVTGFDGPLTVDTSSPALPQLKKPNGKRFTDPKLLQLLGANEDDEYVIADWIVQSSPKAGASNECLSSVTGESDEDDSSPDITCLPWPQKSELPPSFEFAQPTGKLRDEQQISVDAFPCTVSGTCYSLLKPEVDLLPHFMVSNANSAFGDESSNENGTGTASGEDSSVDSLDSKDTTKSGIPLYPSGLRSTPPSSGNLRPSDGYSSPQAPSSPTNGAHSPDRRLWVVTGTRIESMSWGSAGSASPKLGPNGVPHSTDTVNRNLHRLPPPPRVLFTPQQFHGSPGHGTGWTEVSTNLSPRKDWPGQTSIQRVQSPHHGPTRITPHLSPVGSPHPSPPRSPLWRPQSCLSPGPWSPLPVPPLQNNSSPQSPPRSPTRALRKLTKWKKIKQIGTGSFGTVHEAINLDDGSFFAVKVSHDESIPAEIQKEIEVLSMLRHPNVVQYFGTAMEDGHLCIFLELMQNSLQSIIKVFHHFDETLISTYTRQILQGLEYLHQKNTIHRDIKCANILVDKDGQVKLADFGLAKQVGMSLATSCKGTPYFMAPEILKAHSNTKRGYGLPVDIWSLGCTVLEMADGQPPWSFLKGFSFLFKLNKGELPPIPEHLSPGCKDFIKSCLQFRPEDRPTASQLLLHPFVANAPTTAVAAAFVSSAMSMESSMVEGSGKNWEAQQSRNRGVVSDLQVQDFPYHRPALLRSPRLDKSLNLTYGNNLKDLPCLESVQFSSHSPSSLVSSEFSNSKE